MLLTILRIAQMVIPIIISIGTMGYRNKNLNDYLRVLSLQRHEAYWFYKIIFIQVAIYVNIFFTMLVLSGMLIKERIPKKLILVGSIVQIVTNILSSYFMMKFHSDLKKFEFLFYSMAFAFNGLLFTIDAIVMFHQTVFSLSDS